jgi:hypothetical protein
MKEEPGGGTVPFLPLSATEAMGDIALVLRFAMYGQDAK